MSSRTSRRLHRPARTSIDLPGARILLAALVLASVLVSLRWVWVFRHDQPYDIDESGYLGIALQDWLGLRDGGPSGWLAAVEAPSIQAPMTTALASLVFRMTGPHVLAGLLVPVLAQAICVAATFRLARERASAGASLVAAALVATCPMLVSYSRSFHFALPTTATMTLALLCLLRSRHLSRPGWTTLFGICLGLLPLARTVTIAFLPGLVLAALLWAAARDEGRPRQAALFLWSLLVAVLVAASWLWWNGRYVFAYLTSFGYGARATEFGPRQFPLGPAAWLSTLRELLDATGLPHALVLLAGLLATPVVLGAMVRGRGRAVPFAMLASPALPLLVAAGAALAALTSSRNKGSAFMAPVLPALFVLAVWMLAPPATTGSAASAPRARLHPVAALACLLACLVAAVPLVDAAWPTAAPRSIVLPVIGSVPVTDGRGTIELYERNAGFAGPDAAMPLTQPQGAAWIAAEADLAVLLARLDPGNLPVAFGFRNFMLNVNSVRLQMLLAGLRPPELVQIEPLVTSNVAAGDRAWLTTGEAARARLLVTRSTAEGDFQPPVDAAALGEAVTGLGFHVLRTVPLPDGSRVTLWLR